jgi:RimJ/RimL family protein N-acetyltransferase
MKFRLNEGLENIIYKPVEDTDKFKQYAAEILGGDGNMSASDIKASIKEIYIDEKLIGYIGFSEYEEDDVKMLGIGNFMVIERGQGYGTKIINDVVETNKDKYDLIYCFVDADNAGAIKLYKKLGSVYDEDGPNDNGQYYVTFYDNGKFDLDESLTEGLNKSEVKSAMQAIYDEYEKYNDNDGNQNCMLCAWALEMQLRGNKDFLPRPVYSPRDIIFQDINGYDIVVGAEKLSLENKDSVSSIARDAGADTRFYCHVNWAGLKSGHEFLILNIQDTIYIADAQANALVDIEEDDEYFRDINFKNSFLVRLDDKAINDNTLKYNDDEYIIEWDDELDPAFLKGEVTEEFDPPYNEEQIKANYGDETYQRLIDDPAHAWRMKTGLELIHKEPSKKELERIWANWQEMTDEQKAESDKKSIELFGKTNEENYNELIKLYGVN